MKRKGFTLVELLAVIAILAILVIIALPNVIKLFNDAKKNTFLTEVKSLYNQASSKYISESMKGNKLSEINSSDSSKLDVSGDLIYKIKLDNNGKVVSVAVKKGNYCISTTKDSSKVTKSDVKEDCDGFSVLANWYDECKDKNTLRCKILSDNKTYDDSVKSEFVSSTSGINFKVISSDTNGKGLYYSTNQDVTDENNDGLTNRIYYYRGDIKNNFVVLGDKCYKILRTTENGNVKLMYHDNANTDGTCNEKVVYKESTELLGGQVENQVRFNYGNRDATFTGYMTGDTKLTTIIYNQSLPMLLYLVDALDFDNPTINYSKSFHFEEGTYYLDGEILQGKLADLCNKNSCKLKGYYIITKGDFGQTSGRDIAYVESYDKIKIASYSSRVYDNSVYVSETFKDENDKFVLTGNIITAGEAKESCKNKTCYTLLQTREDAKKDIIYKIIAFNNNTNSVSVENITYGTANKKEALSNKNDSQMKKMLDAWYEININNKNLTTKIADEIYCNDRSQLTIDKSNYINEYVNTNKPDLTEYYNGVKDNLSLYGYNSLDDFLKDFAKLLLEVDIPSLYDESTSEFNKTYTGFYSDYRLSSNAANLSSVESSIKDYKNTTYKCKNKIDRFTTSTLGNSKLKYPIATITADEVVRAGGTHKKSNKNYFLANNGSFWTMTPKESSAETGVYFYGVRDDGMIEDLIADDASVNMDDGLVRRGKPVISLKSDIETTKGNGTVSNPYVIK